MNPECLESGVNWMECLGQGVAGRSAWDRLLQSLKWKIPDCLRSVIFRSGFGRNAIPLLNVGVGAVRVCLSWLIHMRPSRTDCSMEIDGPMLEAVAGNVEA
ncbi:hypothetical protein Nepgr_005319 [Nepenthes gracilis]|uniref:Uncharacterized protein n=1 Tax=Nepenthes gracilis TaxID=150966 RepID=A0AAD3XG96_NEPGR|nr:hypothetical protein Nepgr_005319 [Nepenthes gracilis]